MAKYTTPDFDVTLYEIEDRITAVSDEDPDGFNPSDIYGDLNPDLDA